MKNASSPLSARKFSKRARRFITITIFSLLILLLGVSGYMQSLQQGDVANTAPAERANLKNVKAQRPNSEVAEAQDVVIEPSAIGATNNYTFTTDTNGTLTDMSTGTTQLLAANIDDTASSLTVFPFDFFFQGVRYNSFGVNENGVLRLGATAQASTPYKPLAQAGIPILTAYGADQRTHAGDGKVHTKMIGVAPNRVLVVEWLNTQSNFNTGGTADLTYQVRLYETTGVIEYVYGKATMSTLGAASLDSKDPNIGFSSSNIAGTVGSVTAAQSGTPAPTYNGASATPVANLYTAGAIPVLNTTTEGSRRIFTFTPPVPTAPTNLTFTGVTSSAMTLNWTDSANETLYAIYQSTDGTNYSFINTAAQNATSFNASGLTPNTNYFWQVYAVSEGALSTALSGSQATTAAATITSTPVGGNWNATTTWIGNVVPTANDNVVIADLATVTVNVTTAACLNLTVGQGISGTLQYITTPLSTLTVNGDVTVASGGTFTAGTGSLVTHVLNIGGSSSASGAQGNLTVNGTFDMNTTAGVTTNFFGSTNGTLSGSGATCDFFAVVVNKGSSTTSILDVTRTITMRAQAVSGLNLTLTNGTFKLSSASSLTPYQGTQTIIPSTGRLWLNNAGASVTSNGVGTGTGAGSPTINGTLQVDAGTFGYGSGNNTMTVAATGTLSIGGANATVNMFGGVSFTSGATFTMTAGNFNVDPQATNSIAAATNIVRFNSVNVAFTGGTLTIVDPHAATGTGTALSISTANAGTFNFSGSTIKFGNGVSTTAGSVDGFDIDTFVGNALVPIGNVTIDNTATNAATRFVRVANALAPFQTAIAGNLNITNAGGSEFRLNAHLAAIGGNVMNDGVINGNTASSRLYFSGSSPQTYSGTGVAGTVGSPLQSVDFDSSGGVAFNPSTTNNLITNRIILFTGNVTNANKLTLGVGGSSTGTVQIGNTTTPTNAGTFDVAPTFNLGTGGEVISYLRTMNARTTGGEINPTRTLTSMTYDDNDTSHALTIAGGDLTLSSAATALALTNGRVITGSNILSLSSGTATVTRTSGYVDGNFRKTYAATGSKTFEVGTANGFSPVTANVTAGTFPAPFTVKATQGKLPQISGTNALARYWTLDGTGITANLTFNYLASDVTGTVANYVFIKNTGGMLSQLAPTGTPTTTSATINGVSSFSDWTLAEPGAVQSGSIQFDSATYNAGEGAGTVTLNATRTGGSDGAVAVQYTTVDGSATSGAGNDYTAQSGTLNWAAGDMANKTITINLLEDSTYEGDEDFTVTLGAPTGGVILGTPSTATVTINDNDTAPTFSIDDVTMNEGNSGPTSFVFTITKNGTTAVNATVSYETVDGTATSPSDFTAISATPLTFLPAEMTQQVTVFVNGDTDVETDPENFTVHLSNPVNASILDADGTGAIQNDDAATPGTLQFSMADYSVAEDGTSATITVTRTGGSGGAASVHYATSDGSADSSDYTATSGDLNWTDGDMADKTFMVAITNDTLDENDETVNLTLSAATGATLGTQSTATLTITDNDDQPTISVDDFTFTGADSRAVNGFSVTLSAASDLQVTVHYATSDDTAIAGQDYTATSDTLTFMPGETVKVVPVTILADTVYEPEETFFIDLDTPTNATILDAHGIGTIPNDDPRPLPNVVYVDDDFTGPVGSDPDDTGPATEIGYDAFKTIQGGVSGVATSGTVHVAAGNYEEDVAINNDGLNLLGAGADDVILSGAIGGDGSTLHLLSSNITVAGFTITRVGNNTTDWNNSGLNSAGISIQGLTITGTLIRDNVITGNRTGIDINNSNGHTIRNNVIDFNRTGFIFRNQTDNLTVVENFITNNWTVGVLFLDASSGTNSPIQSAAHSAFNNNNLSGNWYGQIVDRQSGVSLPAPGTTNLKNFRGNWFGTTSPVVTTANSAEPGYAAQIPVAYGGSAEPPGGQPDIAGPASANFRYTPFLPSGTDTNVETTPGRGTNGFQGVQNQVMVWPPSQQGWVIQTNLTATAGFVDGPATPPLGVGSGVLSVGTNGNSGAQFRQLGFNGTALVDLTALSYHSYTSNDTSAPPVGDQTIYIMLSVDKDADGTLDTLLFFEPEYQHGYTAAVPDQGDNVLNTWQMWNARIGGWYGINSSNGAPVFAGPGSNVEPLNNFIAAFPNARLNISATTGSLRLVAGFGSGSWDNFVGNVDAVTVGVSDANVVYDFEPLPSLSINDVSHMEGDSGTTPYNFTVTLSRAVDLPVTVSYATVDGTATAPEDYTAIPTTQITFNPGETTKQVTVEVNGDTLNEADEAFTVHLSNPGNSTIADADGEGAITNDDPQPTISVNDVTFTGADSLVANGFTVSLSAASSFTITVHYATSNNTAIAGEDYTAAMGTLTFNPGETMKNIPITILPDTRNESEETFFVDLDTPTNATILDGHGIGTIPNDDPPPTLSIDDVTRAEGNAGTTAFTFTVTKNGSTALSSSVSFTTADGTAQDDTPPSEDNDYQSNSGTLSFGPLETIKTITVLVNGDTLYEANETFTVVLSNPTDATLADGTGLGTITNDDAPSATLVVNTTADTDDGSCLPSPSTCTLREAINAANSNADANTINFQIPANDARHLFYSNDFTPGQVTAVLAQPTTASDDTTIPNIDPDWPHSWWSIRPSVGGLPSITNPVTIDGYTQTGASTNTSAPAINAVLRVELNGSTAGASGDGVRFITKNSTARGLVINRFPSDGIIFKEDVDGSSDGDANAVRGSFIGTDVSGTLDLGNGANGIATEVDDVSHTSDNNNVGGTTPADRNLISGNNGNGILLTSSSSNVIVGNFVGLAANGTTALGNTGNGVEVSGSTIGGDDAADGTTDGSVGARNVISANGGSGVRNISGASTVRGNYIGTDVSGSFNRGNAGAGVFVSTGNGMSIGGTTAGAANLISGNVGDGVFIGGGNSNTVQGNLIGSDISGTLDRGNGANGVNLAGGTVFNTIGGVGAGESNNIVFNDGDGVRLEPTAGTSNSIRGNSIRLNGASVQNLGIDLGVDGITANDPQDTDTGANNLQNFPVIAAAAVTGTTNTIHGTLNSTPGQVFTLDFYVNASCNTSGNGEGATHIGSMITDATNASGDVLFRFHPSSLTIGQVITATATDNLGSTSEFSQCATVAAGVPGEIQFVQSAYTVSEDGGMAAITFMRTGGSDGAVSASFNTSDGSATAGSDYTSTMATVSYADGETGTKTVNVPILDDTASPTYEGDETVNLALSSTSVNLVGGGGNPLVAVLTINDNETQPTLSVNDFTFTGADSAVINGFTVTLSGQSVFTVTVHYTTSNNTAIAGEDYTTATGTLTFNPGETMKQIPVTILPDTRNEPEETFFVDLDTPVNATILDGHGIGTIPNDDPQPTLSIDDVTFNGSDSLGVFGFTVTLSNPSSSTITVHYATSDNTAVAGEDYTTTSGTLTFDPGDTIRVIPVTIIGDTRHEPEETFFVDLDTPVNATILDGHGIGTIPNDDAVPSMSISDVSKAEGDTEDLITFTVTLSNPSSENITAQFTSVEGTATNGDDYLIQDGTVTFKPQQTTANITAQIIGDVLDEGNETFSVVLSNPSGATITDDTGIGTIIDDDLNSGDFDGDGKNDLSVWRPNDDGAGHGKWYILASSDNSVTEQFFGDSTDIIVSGDYNGDGKKEIAFFRPADGDWYILQGSGPNFTRTHWGQNGDIPVPGDYDGDRKTDLAVFRPGDTVWYILGSTNGYQSMQWGISTDKPVPSDYDGDGKTDIAVFRPADGFWYIFGSTNGYQSTQWGLGTDKLVPADYDLDGKTDVAVWRPSTGVWYVYRSSDGGVKSAQWGLSEDFPVAGDYDGDGKADFSVWRPSTGDYYILESSGGFRPGSSDVIHSGSHWGQAGDIPIAARYVPEQ